MDKDYMEEMRKREDVEQEFKNEFVENSFKNEKMQHQPPTARIEESYESDREPNGMDPETIFEKGLSFQKTPDELRSRGTDSLGKEPNGINPGDK